MYSRSDCYIHVISWFGLVLMLWMTPAWGGKAEPKKVIYYGGSPDTQYIRDYWQVMEKMPFNGIGIHVALDRQAWQQGKQSSYNRFGSYVMGPKVFRLEDFGAAIEDLQAAKWHTFTDNFLAVNLAGIIAAPGFNWFDDERWKVIVNNFAVFAMVAAKAGAKGLMLDPEHYDYPIFSFGNQRKIVDRPFEEYMRIARHRGKQVMTAITSRISNPVIFSLFGYSMLLFQLEKGVSLQSTNYALLPAFYDGLLDAIPAGGYLVDGYEFSYGFKERKQFVEAYRRVREEAIKLSAVPDRYREKVKVGFGLWLDNQRQIDYFRPEEFRRALADALDVSDRYVWIYSEGPRFFPPSNLEKSYIEAISRALRAIIR